MNKISKLHAAWIWFWYNDTTRILLVMVPTYFIVLIPLLWFLGVRDSETIRGIAMFSYIAIFSFAMMDNDYENLNKIGLTVYRKKMTEEEINKYNNRNKPKINLEKKYK